MIGLAGGLVPSASALIVLLVAVSQGQLALGVVLIAAFGIGMALALGGIGLAVVLARRRVERGGLPLLAHPAMARVGGALPMASALVVLGVGIVFTLEAVSRIA
jgi:ABC-type nickel/cobalt efflux system permease component RcnA